MRNKIKISEVFSETLGGRYVSDGANSGEEFRKTHLMPTIKSLKEGKTVLIDFDGTYGYPTSFLEEAFGGLARILGKEAVLKKLKFKSDEEPSLIEEVIGYINNAEPDH